MIKNFSFGFFQETVNVSDNNKRHLMELQKPKMNTTFCSRSIRETADVVNRRSYFRIRRRSGRRCYPQTS
jgi:hypothetical protein